MRTSEIDILIVPGWTNSGPDHWQSRWERHFKTARRIAQDNWDEPQREDWVRNIVAGARALTRPGVVVAHSCGVTAVAHAAPHLAATYIAGAFMVAPADPEAMDGWPATHGGFAPTPMHTLPFPSRMIASSNDPHCSIERAQQFAKAWGSDLSIIANAGHINTASGHGPWPEGLLTFGQFLKSLGPVSV
ncbi:MAG: serine hydrolase family protein [Sphingomonadales bacterium]|nr:serine hydrolase family protein [Sphingomonadales bacterium]